MTDANAKKLADDVRMAARTLTKAVNRAEAAGLDVSIDTQTTDVTNVGSQGLCFLTTIVPRVRAIEEV